MRFDFDILRADCKEAYSHTFSEVFFLTFCLIANANNEVSDLQRDVSLTYCLISNVNRPQGYKTFFMLNSVEYEIFPAHKY